MQRQARVDTTPDGEPIESVVERAKLGEQDAFGLLYELYYDRIYRYLSFKVGDQMVAEDLAVDVFIKVIRSIGSYRDRGHPFSSWLFRIAHNLAVDHFRKHARRSAVPLEKVAAFVEDSNVDLDSHVQQKLTMREVDRAMEDLTDLQRQVISLRFAGELSVRETAQALGRNENAIKALQHAGIKKLRRALVTAPAPAHQHA